MDQQQYRSYQYAYNSQQPSYQQQDLSSQSSYYNINNNYSTTKKQYGLSIFNIPIFTHFNPKSAIVNLMVCGKTGDLIIQMAPAIPNNLAIGIRGPVPAGTKVYDYDKDVVSAFTQTEVYGVLSLLKKHFSEEFTNTTNIGATIDTTSITGIINNTTSTIDSIKEYIVTNLSSSFFTSIQSSGTVSNDTCIALYSALTIFNSNLTELVNQNNQLISMMNSANVSSARNSINNNSLNKDSVGMYRRGNNGSDDKAWNFNYDAQLKMLHINCMIGKNKDNRIRISLSTNMAQNLLHVLDSYVNNYVVIQLLCKTNSELSKTLAHNNIMAPAFSESKQYQ